MQAVVIHTAHLMPGVVHMKMRSLSPDPRVVAIARAYAWMEAMEGGKFQNLTQLAQAVGVDEGYVRRQMMEAWEKPIL